MGCGACSLPQRLCLISESFETQGKFHLNVAQRFTVFLVAGYASNFCVVSMQAPTVRVFFFTPCAQTSASSCDTSSRLYCIGHHGSINQYVPSDCGARARRLLGLDD